MSNLFTTVSVEQQEIVAGGGSGLLNETFLSALRNVQVGFSRSTVNGSETGSQQDVQKINTAGRQIGLADFATVTLPATQTFFSVI
ncbi:CTB family bacteriocin [Dolichospermum lemmermannii CS-548]|uniref:CTB family bacteriocin n=1 Tax=Dolichospermum lemmermannii TaxID=54295 RepID=UPI00232B3305|nr:CTB family bacteriocin [Dolichospermum lemmermannii]MDB9439346.1 CTB family bacteriocin [Dolichospermum lemmermannii CS-548]